MGDCALLRQIAEHLNSQGFGSPRGGRCAPAISPGMKNASTEPNAARAGEKTKSDEQRNLNGPKIPLASIENGMNEQCVAHDSKSNTDENQCP